MSSHHRYTEEEDLWLRTNHCKYGSREKLTSAFNSHFKSDASVSGVTQHCRKIGLQYQTQTEWSAEEDIFVIENRSKYSYPELYKKYCERFGKIREFYAFKSHAAYVLKLRLDDPNKYNPFKLGVVSKPVGYETKINGYWMVKVDDQIGRHGSHDAYRQNWIHKHRLVWEQHNGPIPEGYVVTFLDGDHDNLSIENLIMLPAAIQARVNKYTNSGNADLMRMAIKVAELELAIKDAKDRLNEN